MPPPSDRATVGGAQLFIRRSESLLTTELDGEIFGMSVEQGACYGLNAVATRIWTLLAQKQSIEDLCDQLTSEFEVDPDVCRREVADLVQSLQHEGLIEPVDP